MEILVLLAGIIDPNARLTDARIGRLSRGEEAGDETRRLSPFDEAALETALQLRDLDAGTRITAVVVGTKACDRLTQAVAAFRPNLAARLDIASSAFADPAAAVAPLGGLSCGQPEDGIPRPDLVLIGREFGDCDNGALPAYLAEATGRRFVAQVQQIRSEGDRLRLTRTRGGEEEQILLAPPLIASMVNDRGNRLRYPLMKNVILAKREPVRVLAPERDGERIAARLAYAGAAPVLERRTACQWLHGTVDEQADALATLLRVEMGAA
jgi:electron transfer flavoprotein beta subunit